MSLLKEMNQGGNPFDQTGRLYWGQDEVFGEKTCSSAGSLSDFPDRKTFIRINVFYGQILFHANNPVHPDIGL